jgi:hypothetical protein
MKELQWGLCWAHQLVLLWEKTPALQSGQQSAQQWALQSALLSVRSLLRIDAGDQPLAQK